MSDLVERLRSFAKQAREAAKRTRVLRGYNQINVYDTHAEYWDKAADALERAERERAAAISHIKTAIGSLDDPTGPHVVEDVRRVRDVVLVDALVALSPHVLSQAQGEDATAPERSE